MIIKARETSRAIFEGLELFCKMTHQILHVREHTVQYLEWIRQKIYTPIAQLHAQGWVTPEPVPFSRRLEGDYRDYQVGEVWGSLFDCGWFHVTGTVPASACGKKTVLLLDFSGEGCLYDKDGCPIRGITNVSSHYDFALGMPGKRVVPFADPAAGGESVDLWIDAGCNDLFGNFKGDGKIVQLDIALCDEAARTVYYDIVVLDDLLGCLPEDSPQAASILYTLQKAFACLSDFSQEEFEEAHAILQKELSKTGGTPTLSFNALGHAHIDLAWLWPIRETRRKGLRTFSTALEMMERYPDYVFGASQPQLYQWVKEDAPALFEKIRQRVQEGRWELQGGMWVEPDTNMPCGESLVRQFLYGKRFFREEFGVDVKTLWLPDVFGYTAALPQLIKKSGCDYFTTIKLSWSKVNPFPYHTFRWKGLGNCEVLVHMPPEGAYGSAALPHSFDFAAKNYREKGLCDTAMLLFGISDGGGGAGPEHLERLMREKNLQGLYPVEQKRAVDFFEHIAADQERYPFYEGELYLERHQGTLTTQAKSKRFNRKMEIALHTAELACTQASLLAGAQYPQKELEEIWKEVLLYQFHDILPGSSIRRVYDESLARYESLLARTQDLTAQAMETMALRKSQSWYNPLPWSRKQIFVKGDTLCSAELPAFGFGEACCAEEILHVCLDMGEDFLENELLRVTFAPDGSVSSIIEKNTGRECIRPGQTGNLLRVFTDLGDAWDFAIDYRGKKSSCFSLEEVTLERTPAAVIRKSVYRFGNSTLWQEVSLAHGCSWVDFRTKISWHEKDKMLRAEFPINVDAPEVSCDIQFGHIRRSTGENNSLEYAQVEIAAHKWLDLSEPDFGVSMLSESKYGFYAKNGILSMNLLRSQNYPGEQADIGEHSFSYAIYPHQGDLFRCQVEKAAAEYNVPPVETEFFCETKMPVTPVQDNILVDTVKMSEDGKHIIVRLHEYKGSKTQAQLHLADCFTACTLVNLIEDPMEELVLDNGSVSLPFGAFEIHTLALTCK